MKIFLFALVLVLFLEDVTSDQSSLERPETIKPNQRKFTPCIWKICSKPLRKNFENNQRIDEKATANKSAIFKILSTSKFNDVHFKNSLETLKRLKAQLRFCKKKFLIRSSKYLHFFMVLYFKLYLL